MLGTRLLPEAMLRWCGDRVAGLFYACNERRRTTTLTNLALAFPEKSDADREKIARAAYRHFASVVVDNLLVMTNRRTRESFAADADLSALDSIRQQGESGRGVIMITGHLGQWELMAQLAESALGRGMVIVTRYLSNALLEERIVQPFRAATGVTVVYKDKALITAAKTLKKGGMLGLLVDQKTGERDGVPATFLGQPITCLASSAQLQLRLKADAMAAFLVRDGNTRLELIVSDPIIPQNPDADDAVEQLVQQHQDAISDAIRKYPEQWFWMHDRFRLGNQKHRKDRIQKRVAQKTAADNKDVSS